MSGNTSIILFTLDEQRYGIPLEAVEKVVRMVEITHVPEAPRFIHGVINVQGIVLPVLNLRRRFGMPERTIELSDQLIIVRCATHRLALMTDTECEVRECPELLQTESSDRIPDLPFLAAVVKLPDGLILLQDPEKLLLFDESEAINELIGREQP